jgi:hypothetical protein
MLIVEHQNKKIKLKKINMNTDAPIDGNENTPINKYNFSMLICGIPGSGKTNLVISQLTSTKGLLYKKFDKVFIFSPSIKTIQKEIKLPEDQIIDSFDVERLAEIIEMQKMSQDNSQVLIIFDDMMMDIIKDKTGLFSKLVANRRHLGISLIAISQVFNRIPSKYRKMFSDFILFRTNNKKEISFFGNELTAFSESEFVKIFLELLKNPHDFLMVKSSGQMYKNFNRLEFKEEDS